MLDKRLIGPAPRGGEFGVKGAAMKIEDQIRRGIRQKGFSRKTEESYVDWYKKFVPVIASGAH